MERSPGGLFSHIQRKTSGKTDGDCGMNRITGQINEVKHTKSTCMHIIVHLGLHCHPKTIHDRQAGLSQALYTSLGIFLPAYLDVMSNHHSST